MTEANLSDRVSAGLKAAAQTTRHHVLEWERHESSTIRSIPDARLRWASFSPWVELKVAKGRLVKFQPGQTRWLRRQWASEPGTAWVLVGVPGHSKRKAGIALYRGEQADVLAGIGIVACEPELWLDAPIRIAGWVELLDRLTWGGCYCECTEPSA